MATYEKVINVISQKPDLRKDFEVNNLLPWFRKKSQLFANLKTELLFDIIKNLQFVTKERDDIIIKQGDQGDCMYIMMRGQVTIYILYAAKGDADEDKPNQPQVTAKGSEAIRQQLGTFVTNLGAGATFGEVALMTEDCPRTASIIANETTDLIVVDRELYNRSVKNVLKQEFEDKANFIADNKYFQGWPPKYKKQLTMALQKETVPYEGMLVKQGDAMDCIYFVLTGEIKLVVDPQAHKAQYAKILDQEEPGPPSDKAQSDPDDESEDSKSVSNSKERSGNEIGLQYKFRRKSTKRQPQEVCLLGVNESIGDIEVLMDLETYLQSAICTQRTDVLVLEMKHYERLLVKRNPRSIEAMKEDLEMRLKSRINKNMQKSVPIYRCLISKAHDYNLQRQQQSEARQNSTQERHVKHVKTIGETFDSFVPPQGALIDMYGPGTVFHRIRQREAAKAKKQERLRYKNGGYSGFHGIAATSMVNGSNATNKEAEMNGTSSGYAPGAYSAGRSGQTDHLTSDPVLSDLESRMKAWLANEYEQNQNERHISSRFHPQVAKLHRAPHLAEADKIKPGVKVVIRPKDRLANVSGGPSDFDEAADDAKHVHHGSSWV